MTCSTGKYEYEHNKKVSERKHGRAGKFILGGMHMTHYGYLPYLVLNQFSSGEGEAEVFPRKVEEMARNATLRKLEVKVGVVPVEFRPRTASGYSE